MSVSGDFDYLLPPSRRRTATNGSTAGRDDDDKLVPLLESYSSLTSSMTSNSDTVYAPGFSYISTVSVFQASRQGFLALIAASRFLSMCKTKDMLLCANMCLLIG